MPYPFGHERTGYLVTDMDAAIRHRAAGADVIVAPFNDPIGRDVVIQFPGGVNMQLYWHTSAPSYAEAARPCPKIEYTYPRIRPTRSSIASSSSRMVKSSPTMPARQVSKLGDRTTRIGVSASSRDSVRCTVLVTDGHLPYPYGYELTGYDVDDLSETLKKAKAAGAKRVGGTLRR